MEDIDVCPNCGGHHVRQDEDVLDTWFSSQLWTFATQGWPDHLEQMCGHHPTKVLVTARDIIALWVARMVMSSLYFKKYSTSIQEKVVEQFIKTGLIDDLYYAKAFTRDKLKLNHYGPIRIQMELKKKGIDEAFIDETLKEVSKEILIETAYEASIKKMEFR